MMTIKSRAYEILEGRRHDRASNITNLLIVALIGMNLLAFTLSTVKPLYQSAIRLFDAFEAASVFAFTAEYLLRLWSCTSDEKYSDPIAGRLRFAATPFLLADFLAILPFYLPFAGLNFLFLRMVRVNRLFRVIKLGRYSKALQTFARVVAAKRYELMTALAVIMLGLFLGSSFEYFAEHDAQPDRFSSIPASLWWGVTTMTTVGYGDVVPKTVAGKIIGSLAALLGIAIFALPAGILAAGFVEEFQDRHRELAVVCQHCGKSLH
jgi:voltage-gated potassium channel